MSQIKEPYRVIGEQGSIDFADWTAAQDFAVSLLKDDGEEFVSIHEYNPVRDSWGLLQELNLERGIMPDPNFNTHSLAPYYVRLRNL